MKNLSKLPAFREERVRTALLLAAGTGSRLSPLTDNMPKCLVPVNEISILERLVFTLRSYNFKRLVIVVGHQADCIRTILGTRAGGMEITYVNSPLYKTTNNIYSLWLAGKVIEEPFLLVESDLVFHPEMLKDMLHPDRIAVAGLQTWMNGTTVTINRRREIKAFHCGAHKHDDNHYKTVNLYSLSTMTWQLVRERLDRYIANNMVDGYYENIFADMVNEGCLSFTPVFFDTNRWYEIDTIADLQAAEEVCGLHHRLPALTDLGVNSPKGQACKRLPTIARIKRGPPGRPESKASTPMSSASPLSQ